MSTVKRQHYVPQFYLRGFSIAPGQQKLHVYDKTRKRTFIADVAEVASRRHYYDVPELDAAANTPQAVEKWLGAHEQAVAPILAKTLDALAAGTFDGFSEAEKIELALFIAVQHLRTEEARERTAQLHDSLPQEILDAFPEADEMARAARTPEGRTKFHVELLLSSAALKIARVLASRTWVVVRRTRAPWVFLTSDNPVLVISPWGESVGPCSDGVEIALPLSPDYVLSIVQLPSPWKIVPAFREDVRRYNLIQTDFANTQLFSPDGDFRLVEKRIQAVPEIADPRRRRIVTNDPARFAGDPP